MLRGRRVEGNEEDKVVEIRMDVEGSGTLSDSLSASRRGDLHVKEGYCFLYISPSLKPSFLPAAWFVFTDS